LKPLNPDLVTRKFRLGRREDIESSDNGLRIPWRVKVKKEEKAKGKKKKKD
jgi:hypothetical protein